MASLLFVAGLYCLADLFLFLRFRTRLTPTHFSLLSTSFWSSFKSTLPLFGLAAILLWVFPILSLTMILVAKWPHPFLTAFRTLRKKRPSASFPLSKKETEGSKLFDIDTSDKPHILFVVLESFRAKSIGPLTPQFNKLAKNGIHFTQFHSTGNLTNRAMIASLFGIQPAHEPWHLGHYANLPLVGLAQILAKHGYHPALIQGGSTAFDNEAEFFGKHGFKTILGKRDIGKPGTSWGCYDEFLMPFAASWLEKQKTPAFLNLYTITNHHPWIHPKGKNGFLNTFAYTDAALGLLIEELEKKNLLKKSILFIFGDHGQELEDRDPHFEINRHLYQDNIHVPLLIYAEGRIQTPQKIETVSSQIDLLPTVLDLMDLSEPHQGLGKSLLRPSEAPVFFSHPFDTPIRGCRKGSWKYIEPQELYDLSTDPEEKINRIGEGTELKEEMERFFDALDAFYSDQPMEKKESPLHLDFSNSLEMNDALLEKVAQNHPELSSIYLSNCLLLTDIGIRSLLAHCPKLEKLYIDGIDEIRGTNWPPMAHLTHLNALNCPHLSGRWVTALPSLRILFLGSMSITDQDLIALPKLSALYLSHLYGISDQGLKPLLAKSSQLAILSLEDCPQITDESIDAIQSSIFRYKTIKDCPSITRESL